jgi:pyruvate dehydrogenase E2 component (dihydrolipoamide acetyltransferase)
VVTVGAVSWRPRVVDGEIVPRRAVEVGVTIDHRLVDGAQGARFGQVLRDAIERPWEVWPALGGRVEARARARHP